MAAERPEQRQFALLTDTGVVDPGIDVGFGLMVGRNLVQLSTLLAEAEPPTASRDPLRCESC